jgi:CRP-like cAMP-binding protein
MARETGTDAGSVELPALTQGEVASLVAGTRQRVNAVLGDLGREGLIAYDGKRITVLDVEQLDRRIGW